MSCKKLFSLAAVGLLVFGFAFTANGWWDSNWSDRLEMTIDNTTNSNTLTNYQVRIIVDWFSGMQANFGDLRFIDTDDVTKLDYWVEGYTASTVCTVWVEIPSIPGSSTKTIYLYYGNAGASSESSGPNTFQFFDDFNDGSISDWSASCGRVDHSGEYCNPPSTDNSDYISAPYSLSLYGYASCYSSPYTGVEPTVSKTLSLSNDTYKLDFYERDWGGQWGYCSSGRGGKNYAWHGNTRIYNAYAAGHVCYFSGCGRCATDWASASSNSFTVSGGSATIRLSTHATDCEERRGWFDDVRIRKYADPEPRGGIAGPAEILVRIEEPPKYIQGGLSYIPIAFVKNIGGEPATNIAVACSIWTYGELEYHDTRTIPSLSAWGANTTVEFDPWLCDGFCGQTFPIRMSTDFADAHPENNFDDDTLLIMEEVIADWTFEPTDDDFTHSSLSGCYDDWRWGIPGTSYGGPSSAYSPPNCWGTILNGHYHNRAGCRLLSPKVAMPYGTKKLRFSFYHYYYTEDYWDGGNVKFSKDGGSFERITPVGGYTRTLSTSACGVGGQPGYCGSKRNWTEAIFDIPFDTPVNEVQFAWDFGTDYSVNGYCGWYIDDVRLLIRYPPLAITDIGGIPALVGINCVYIPTAKVKNMTGKRALKDIYIHRVIGKVGEPFPEYKSLARLAELAKDAEEEVTFDPFTAPSEPGVLFYDSVFAGPGGVYIDTLFRVFVTGVDVGDHKPIEPMDSIYTKTCYFPTAMVNALIGCDVPTHAVLQLRDSIANVLYLCEKDAILKGPQEEVIFDSVSVDVPGWYTFVLATYTEADSNFKNDTLKWDVKAVEAGALNVGVIAIDMPDKTQPGDSLHPKATVENGGEVTVSFNVECTIEPGDYIDTKEVTNLEPGATQEVGFKVWVPEEVGRYTVTVTTKLEDTNPDDNSKEHKINVIGVAEKPLPSKFELSCIRPNPFSINTEISYQLPHSSKVSLAIYDISGKLVKTLVNRHSSPGYYTVNWDGRNAKGKNMAAGLYFVKLLTPEYKATRKVVLMVK